MGALDGRTLAVIGLGLMGRPMARNLKKAGATVVIHNRSPGPMDELAGEGMAPAESPADAVRRAETAILMLSDTPAVAAVLDGASGVIAGLEDGKLIIDMGTSAVAATRGFAARVEAAGGDYVDAPVSGGQVGAEAGTLSIMAGGSEAAFARAEPVFKILGERVTHVGDVGAGQVAKAANQVIVGLTIGAVAEAFTLARRAGVDPARVREAIMGGFAGSRILELHGERMVTGDFAPGGYARTQLKDMVQALELAEQSGVALPAVKLNRELYERLVAAGHGELDHSALIKIFEPN